MYAFAICCQKLFVSPGLSLVILFFILCFQAIIAQVNHAIGASGVVSQECKAVVSQYGETIIDMLLAKVYDWFLTCFYCHAATWNLEVVRIRF